MFKDFNYQLILKLLGSLLLVESVFMISSVFVALYYHEHTVNDFLICSLITFLTGVFAVFLGRKASPFVGKREGSVIVTSIWLLFSFFGLLPYVVTGSIPSVTNAFFETMSGFTTTGASILNNIEEMPKSILYWRSLTHWIGGLGIIVISMALLPIFGFSSVQLFSAEATGPTKDKIHPKMSETAKRLLAIYFFLTFTQAILLKLAGMGWFDALNHSFTTMATGGFSTKQSSIGHWDSAMIQYIIIFFMLSAGVNFSMFYFLLKGKFEKVFGNAELKFYLSVVAVFTLMIFFSNNNLWIGKELQVIEHQFRNALFIISSTITTTGFVTVDYMLMHPLVWIIVIVVMLMGASAGSTAGGIKQIRVYLVLKYAYYEFKRIIHPNAIFPISYNKHIVKDDVITRVLSFVMLYFIVIFVGAMLLAINGMGFIESLSGVITCISNVGPGLGTIGPVYSYAGVPDFSKWIMSITMLIGRLELFTVLVLLTPIFWKR